jgi:hypothetical protein
LGRLGEKSQKLGNRLVACTRRCHGRPGGHARRETGGGKTPGAGEGGKGEWVSEGVSEGRDLEVRVWHAVIVMIVIVVLEDVVV